MFHTDGAAGETYSEHRLPAPSKDVVNQRLEFAGETDQWTKRVLACAQREDP